MHICIHDNYILLCIIVVLYISRCYTLPATLQCTDNDLAYLERIANIKLLKELTVSTYKSVYSQLH